VGETLHPLVPGIDNAEVPCRCFQSIVSGQAISDVLPYQCLAFLHRPLVNSGDIDTGAACQYRE
jgi:hypothetical protein